MRAGWLRFGRNGAVPVASAPDKAVAAAHPWLLGAAIVASTAALLGTSDVNTPTHATTYSFERKAIEGGGVELTRDQPSATFFVTVHADALGPEGVISTNGATLDVDGTISSTGLSEGAAAPFVTVNISSPDVPGTAEQIVLDRYRQAQALVFAGDCDTPPGSTACRARFTVQVARNDDGAGDGVVRFDWLFDLYSKVQQPSSADSMVGPLDPPWTVEVTQP